MKYRNHGKPFTLIELLICVAVIGILVAMLLPALSRTREKARRVVCLNNQHQMTLRMLEHAKTNSNKLAQDDSGYPLIGILGDTAFMAYIDADFTRTSSTSPKYLSDISGAADILYCPSAVSQEMPWYYATGRRWYMRTSPLFLGGYDVTGWSGPNPVFNSPLKLTSDPETPLFTCGVSYNAANRIFRYLHGLAKVSQGKFTDVPPSVTPADLGCEGTTVVRLDGSGRFEPMNELTKYQYEKTSWDNRRYLPPGFER